MRYIAYLLYGSLWLTSILAAPAYAQKTEQDIIHLFLQNNLDLISAKMQLDGMQAQALIAQQYQNPQLSLNVSGLGDAKGYADNYWQKPYDNVLRLEQLIETAGKRQLRITSAELGIEIQHQQFKDLLRALTRDVREAYYKVVLSQHLVDIYDEILLQFKNIEQANRLRWKAGDISETEFQRSELEVQKAETDVASAHLRLASERQLLAQLLSHGVEWQSLVLVSDFPKFTLPNWSDREWIKKALLARADYAATETAIQQKQIDVQRAERLSTPDVTLGAQYQHNATASIPDSLGIGVSVSLPLWHQHQGELALANTEKRSAFVARQQLGVQIKTQVAVALAEFKQKQEALQRFDDRVLDKAKQVRNASSLAYRQGAISLLELLDAERNYRNLLIDYKQAQFDQTSAWFDLMYAIGQEGSL